MSTTNPEPEWTEAGYLDDGGIVYSAPARTPPPFVHDLSSWAVLLHSQFALGGSAYTLAGIPPMSIRRPTDDEVRERLGIPPGFPLWYRPEPPALPVGPVGRRMMRAQTFLQRLAIVEAERWALPDNPLDPSAWLGDHGGGESLS